MSMATKANNMRIKDLNKIVVKCRLAKILGMNYSAMNNVSFPPEHAKAVKELNTFLDKWASKYASK